MTAKHSKHYEIYLVKGERQTFQAAFTDESCATGWAAKRDHVLFPGEKLEVRRVSTETIHTYQKHI